MRIVFFCHSLISDWNHGNAHFLRGIVAELLDRSHDVVVYEPANGWSRQQLLAHAGPAAISRFHSLFPPAQVDARRSRSVAR
jgi:spore maturation protein CgeB